MRSVLAIPVLCALSVSASDAAESPGPRAAAPFVSIAAPLDRAYPGEIQLSVELELVDPVVEVGLEFRRRALEDPDATNVHVAVAAVLLVEEARVHTAEPVEMLRAHRTLRAGRHRAGSAVELVGHIVREVICPAGRAAMARRRRRHPACR